MLMAISLLLSLEDKIHVGASEKIFWLDAQFGHQIISYLLTFLHRLTLHHDLEERSQWDLQLAVSYLLSSQERENS